MRLGSICVSIVYVSACVVCFEFDCVVELFVECVFHICVGEVIDLSLKVIMSFLGCVVSLLANPCIVFQGVCVLCL